MVGVGLNYKGNKCQKDKEFTVLFEQENNDGLISGFTENYIRVKTEFDEALVNKLFKVKLKEMDLDGSYKTILKQHEPITAL